MPWVRFDDQFLDHPKIAANLGPLGIALHLAGIVWSSRNLADGIIPDRVVPRLLSFDGIGVSYGKEIPLAGESFDAVQPTGWYVVNNELFPAHVWHDAEGAADCPSAKCHEAPRPKNNEVLIHDYLAYQPSRAEVLAERAARQSARSAAAVAGGKARAANAQREGGRFTSGPAEPPASDQPAGPASTSEHQLSTSRPPAPVPDTRNPVPETLDPDLEPVPEDQHPRAASGAANVNGKKPNPFGIDAHQEGLLLRLWEQRPEWTEGSGALTHAGLVKLMKKHGIAAVNEALEELVGQVFDVDAPYPWLDSTASGFAG